MDSRLRDFFDTHLDAVLAQLPPQIHRLLDEVTMYVEDHPSREVMRQLGIRNRRQLCGLYTGVPLGNRSIEHSGVLSDAVHVYREGVLALSQDRQGAVDEDELRRQIRITVLHELGHHFGMTEKDLRDLGYG